MHRRFAWVVALLISCGSSGDDPVELRFSALVGDQAFDCGSTYALGAGLDLTPRDFRFYVHDVRLLTADGEEVPVTLDDDGRWQNGEVVLLDFEDQCGEMGNPDMNDRILGVAPSGDYTGIRFRLGVPESLNHADASLAGAPLNLTSMFWNWNAGYKFIRIDGASSAFDSWRLHLGSTGCTGDMMGNATCSNLNVPEITITGFDPTTEAVVADIGALVNGSDLANTDETQPGCMSSPADPDCASLFGNLGLSFGDSPAPAQSFFRAP
ncbi:MAG: MbnP family copper-binding protein [Myxococcota bacterium]